MERSLETVKVTTAGFAGFFWKHRRVLLVRNMQLDVGSMCVRYE